MLLSKGIIAFRRGKVLVSSRENIDPRNLNEKRNLALISLLGELGELDYYISPEVLCRLTIDDMEEIHKNVLPYINEVILHNGESFKPLYPGFPEQVIEKTDAELLIDQDRVYSGDLDGFIKDNPWRTNYQTEFISVNPDRELKMMTEEEFLDIPNQIMSSGNSLTSTTREELVWFLSEYKDIKIPERIPFKETLCLVASVRQEVELKEVNDVLRYGIYLMGGSPDLPNVPKQIPESSWSSKKVDNPEWRNLKSLPRKRRREICDRLEKIIESKGIENCVRDAKSNYGHWILLSERVHPGEFQLNYSETTRFFHYLKSHDLSKQYRTFNSQVQNMYDSGKDILDIAKFVSNRPGELVRRFDSLYRKACETGKEDKLLDIFFDTKGMKNKTLLELLGYYDRRNSDVPRFIKTESGKSMHKLDPLPKISDYAVEIAQEIIMRKVLLNIDQRITEKDLDKKIVYIDPELKKLPIPKDMRDMNISIPRSTRFKIPGDKILRFFVHWRQEKDKHEDLDLHAYLWKSENDCAHIGFNSTFKGERNIALHSGDVIDRPGDCAEYVDVDIQKAKNLGFKYIVADICNYRGRGLDSLPCWTGYSVVEKMYYSKTWKPENVELSVEMNCKESNVAAFLVDIDNSEIMILDCPISGIPVITRSNYSTQNSIIKFFTVEHKFSSFDIIQQYYKSRGASIITELPREEDLKEMKIEIHEKVTFEDMSKDYVKILSIIGE